MKMIVDQTEYDVEIVGSESGARVVNVNGRFYAVTVLGGEPVSVVPVAAPQAAASPAPTAPKPSASAPVAAPAASAEIAAGQTPITAPMPGTVLDVKVGPGDNVAKGQALMVLESMKMENNLPAPVDGTVVQVLKNSGDQVTRGELLLVLGDA